MSIKFWCLVAVALLVLMGITRSDARWTFRSFYDDKSSSKTYDMECMFSIECSGPYEMCSWSTRRCVCIPGHVFDDDRLQCREICAEEAKLVCGECCPSHTHVCRLGVCEPEWPGSSYPHESDRPLSIALIVIYSVAGLSLLLLLWHCCCHKDPHVQAAPVAATVAVQSSVAQPIVEVRANRTTHSDEPPSYTEAMKSTSSAVR